MLYNPWQHAKALSMRIIERDFTDDNILGLYLGKGAIALNSSMTYPVARCILAHEIVHAEKHHEPGTGNQHPAWVAYIERECDRIAALRLITADDLQRLSDCPACERGGVIADELMVTENVLALRFRLADGL